MSLFWKVLIALVPVLVFLFKPLLPLDDGILGLLILLACLLALWLLLRFPSLWRSVWGFRLVGLLLLAIGAVYWWLSLQSLVRDVWLATLLHFVGFTGLYLCLVLNFINQSRPKNHTLPPPLPARLPPVVLIIPTCGEPYAILEQTVIAAKQQDYPAERLRILISDDSHRDSVRALAAQHGVYYIKGPRRDAKAGNLNHALGYIQRRFPHAEYIAPVDADEVLQPAFLKKVIPYFADRNVALVQTPKEAITPVGDPFGTRDRAFYDRVMVGRNGDNAAFSCGSGCVYRLTALNRIGGFASWNMVEDLTTSYTLHAAGYKSEYHNEILSVGLAPEDIPGLLKQRGTWAVDAWRLMLFDNPLLKRGLTAGQRRQYLETGVSYAASAFFTPLVMAVPMLCAATGRFIDLHGVALLAWVAAMQVYYLMLANGNFNAFLRARQFWDGMGPTHLKALWIALGSRQKKPAYQVTRKTRKEGLYVNLVWVQCAYVFMNVVFIVRLLFGMPNDDLTARLSSALILLYYVVIFSGICLAAFHRSLPVPQVSPQLRTLGSRFATVLTSG